MRGLFLTGAALFAGLAAAQVNITEINNLPPCGKVCITNMLGQAQQLGCSSEADITCLCNTPNFQYGVRDCINESCSAADAATVSTFGNSLCAGVGSGSSVETVTATQTAGTTTLLVSTGTDSAGQPFTTTLGALGVPSTGVGVIITTTDSAGSTFTTTLTVAATTIPGNATVITTTDTAGQTTLVTVTGSSSSTGGGVVVSGTNSAGSTVVTTLNATTTTGATVLTTTNSVGSTITTTKALVATTSSTGSGSGSGSGPASSSTSAAFAGHLAAPAFGGVAGFLALLFL